MRNDHTNISLKSLEVFLSILETGSATAAAERLDLSQPGVSRALASLEENVGFQLFYREKGRLIPSEEAIALKSEVELAITSVERVSILAKNLFKTDHGTLKVVAPNSFIAGPLSIVVAKFLSDHPNVNINLETHPPALARELVAHKTVDCGFTQLPDEHPRLEYEAIVKSGTVCVVPREHPLAKKASIGPKDLKSYELILLGKGRETRRRIDEVFRKAGIRKRVKIETHTVAIACRFVELGIGIAIVNELLADQYDTHELVLIPFTPSLTYEYGFMTSAYAPMNRLTKKFREYCREYFKLES